MEIITYGTVFLPRLKSRLLRRHQTRTLFRRFGSAMMSSKPRAISFAVHFVLQALADHEAGQTYSLELIK